MRKILLTLLTTLLCSITAWGATAGTPVSIFSTDFSSATAHAYAVSTAENITGAAAGNFDYIASNSKGDCGIAINSSSGGNSVNATGKFQVYANNTGYKWSAVENTDFESDRTGGAPTALKIVISDVYFNCISSGTNIGVNFAIGQDFSNTYSSAPSEVFHSGFSIPTTSSSTFNQFNSTTNLVNTAITLNGSTTITWFINNTGASLTYTGPDGKSYDLPDDKFALWTNTTKIVTEASATTGTKTLTNLYIGSTSGKKHTIYFSGINVYDISPACATPTAPTGLSAGSITTSGATLTITDAANTNNYEIYCSTSSTAPTASTVATATGTSKTIAVSGLTPSTTYYVWVRSVCDATHKSDWVALTGTTFNTADCPSSGTIVSVTAKTVASNTGLDGSNYGSEVTLNTTTHLASISGGSMVGYSPGSNSSTQIRTTNSGTFYWGSDASYFKINLDCPLKTGDVLTFDGQASSYQLCFTTTSDRLTTYSSSSQSWTVPDAFNNASTLYIWRVSSSGTTAHSITITRSGGCSAPTSPSISGTTAYTAGNNISLTASATGTSGTTTYTWYKGADWATASASSPVQAASTSGATFTKASCSMSDADTYWCNISNGTGCDVQVSQAITVACKNPTQTFTNSDYTIGGAALNLSTKFSSNSSGAVTYTVQNAGETGASIAGTSFSATTEGTATVRASQAADGDYCTKTIDASVSVAAADCTDPELTITLN